MKKRKNFKRMDTFQVLRETREAGADLAWSHNKEAETGCVGTSDLVRRGDAIDRLEAIANIVGDDAARTQFGEGYDQTIDFSLNCDWRLPA